MKVIENERGSTRGVHQRGVHKIIGLQLTKTLDKSLSPVNCKPDTKPMNNEAGWKLFAYIFLEEGSQNKKFLVEFKKIYINLQISDRFLCNFVNKTIQTIQTFISVSKSWNIQKSTWPLHFEWYDNFFTVLFCLSIASHRSLRHFFYLICHLSLFWFDVQYFLKKKIDERKHSNAKWEKTPTTNHSAFFQKFSRMVKQD